MIQEWGKSCKPYEADIKWKVPTEKSLDLAQNLVDEFIGQSLDSLKEVVASNTIKMSKEKLRQTLKLLSSSVGALGEVFPFRSEDDDVAETLPSVVNIDHTSFVTSVAPKNLTINGQHARKSILEVLDKLQVTLLEQAEDDAKTLVALVHCYHHVMTNGNGSNAAYEVWNMKVQEEKDIVENPVLRFKSAPRQLHIHKAFTEFKQRAKERNKYPFSSHHVKALDNILTLATSHYSSVRISAQGLVDDLTLNFNYVFILPRVIGMLKKDKASHEEFKGALHVALGGRASLLVKEDWETLRQLWPALAQSRHSEKPSISALIRSITQAIFRSIKTFALVTEIPDDVVKDALLLYETKTQVCFEKCPSNEEILAAKSRAENAGIQNIKIYEGLLNELCDLMETQDQLHWRHQDMVCSMLTSLLRVDHPVTLKVVRLATQGLINERLDIRKWAIITLAAILKQQKRAHPKKAIIIKSERDSQTAKALQVTPGVRKDNAWLCYDSTKVPNDQEAWDNRHFMHKPYFGFYQWPKETMVYDKENQPKLNRTTDELSPLELEIYNFFTDQEKVDKFIRFLSLEENKGKDSFDSKRFVLFKGLFRNYGDCLVPLFKPHIERLVQDSNESLQRCATEIICGLVTGSKHWSFQSTKSVMKDFIVPVMKTALSNISEECFSDWGTCFATAANGRDPYQMHWILEALTEEPIRSQGSLHDTARLFVLQGVLCVGNEWKLSELCQRLIQDFEPFMSHPYKNVRDRLSSILTTMLMADSAFAKCESVEDRCRIPKVKDVIEKVLPRLELLVETSSDSSTPAEPADNLAAIPTLPLQGFPPPGPPGMMMLPPGPMGPMPMPPGMMVPPPGALGPMPRLPGMMGPMPRMMPPPGAMPIPPGVMPIPPGMPMMMMQPPNGVVMQSGQKQEANHLLQVVAQCMTGLLCASHHKPKEIYFKMLPVLCANEWNELEPNVAFDCRNALAFLCHNVLEPDLINACLTAVEDLVTNSRTAWKAKVAALEFLQVAVFSNMPSILSNAEMKAQVLTIVEKRLLDSRIEVRDTASEILSGLLHTSFIDEECRTKLLVSMKLLEFCHLLLNLSFPLEKVSQSSFEDSKIKENG